MKAKTLFHNGRIHTQADFQVVDSMAVSGDRIVAVGKHLEKDPEFKAGFFQEKIKLDVEYQLDDLKDKIKKGKSKTTLIKGINKIKKTLAVV